MSRSTKYPGVLGSRALCLALSAAPLAVTAAADSSCSEAVEGGEGTCEQQAASKQIEIVEVYGISTSPYRAERSGDVRRLMSLSDTPQTLSILTQQQIKDSGKTDLKQIVSAQAGITLGTGENGNAFGDRYIIRGHEARSDVFVDGLRDPGMTTRESFASEQVEITKGPSATFAGRGSSGGAVNSITKQATPDESFNNVDAGVGTDDYYRVVLDSNMAITEDSAVRLNLLKADETVPDRDGIERSRDGLLLSGYVGATDKLSFIGDAYYLNAEDVPDLGSYFDSDAREPVEDIPVYAQREDFLDTEVKAFTLRTNYEFNEDLSLHNATRFGSTDNGYVTTGARGTVRDESDPVAPGADTVYLSTHQGWQEVEYGATQFNLNWDQPVFGLDSKWILGLEYSDEKVDNGVYDISYNGDPNCIVAGRRGATEGYCMVDGGGQLVSDVNSLMQRQYTEGDTDAQSEIETVSLYAMNVLSLTEDLDLFLGLRQDSFDYQNDVVSRGEASAYDYSDDLTNGHLGMRYDLSDIGNIYFNYATATNINGGESDVGGSCGYGGLCGDPEQVGASKPERVENVEIGTKWELFDSRLLATAALFQITKSDVMENVGSDYETLGTLNTGKNRVEGVEFSLTGAITDQLSIQMSATIMDSEVLKSIDEENEGRTLSNFADESLYVQLRYQPSDAFAFGASATYQSEMYGGQPDSAAGYDDELGDYSVVVPSYTVYDLFADYYYSEDLNFRLNVGNALDEEYWTAAYRSGAFMYLGDARSVKASVTWQF
ncbi:TonB-dependent siderophore receptor [Halioglobus maricola]|uniref:TonB-dependent siderophore receptor n=1 Tax=Halioglobus maricola TaxID=2601894 RepID=A0A5P9NGR2_9GAMM|nr:TonB-dependent receptor [Halioglobus maricola]QFU74729.1 TonB-dependent siderophore receptor [Halioglobus maricola]